MLHFLVFHPLKGLLNLRGSDLKYSPLFFAYLIIMVNERKIFFHLSKSDRFNAKIYNHFYMEGIDVEPMPYDVLINIREVVIDYLFFC